MAKPINTPVTGNIWHLSIDDLFAPLPEKTRLGGSGPFVINLSASTAPIDLPPKGFDAGRDAHVYQVQRTEDRRLRYRLRLGPFANEDDADVILKRVRDVYPGALTATAEADDLRAIATLQVKSAPAARFIEPIPAVRAEPPPAVKLIKPAPLVLSLVEELPAAPPVITAPAVPPVLRDRIAVPQQAHAASAVVSSATPPPVVTAPAIPVIPAPVMPSAPAVAVAPKPVIAPPSRPLVAASRPAAPAAREAPVKQVVPAPRNKPSAPGAAGNSPNPVDEPKQRLLSVESTQTVRALSILELESEPASRWFVIQLSLSEEAFDSEAVPNLDIFDVYRLYSVAGIDQGRIVHALRLGFFGEENAAAAVASYLAEFYENPTVKRVSSAERDRFAEQRFEPRKDVGATGKHAVIEITNERYIREKRITSTTAVSQHNK